MNRLRQSINQQSFAESFRSLRRIFHSFFYPTTTVVWSTCLDMYTTRNLFIKATLLLLNISSITCSLSPIVKTLKGKVYYNSFGAARFLFCRRKNKRNRITRFWEVVFIRFQLYFLTSLAVIYSSNYLPGCVHPHRPLTTGRDSSRWRTDVVVDDNQLCIFSASHLD